MEEEQEQPRHRAERDRGRSWGGDKRREGPREEYRGKEKRDGGTGGERNREKEEGRKNRGETKGDRRREGPRYGGTEGLRDRGEGHEQ